MSAPAITPLAGGRRAVSLGPLSTVVEPRLLVVVSGLALVLVGLLAAALSIGDFPIALDQVLPAALGRGGPDADFIVRTLRLPRALTGVLVGAAFGLSGSLFQRLSHNGLASPDLIGITAGASLGAVLVIVTGATLAVGVATGALLGAVATATAMYLLAWRRGVTGTRLVLVGIALTAVLTAGTQFLLTRADITDVGQATVWLTGSLNGRSWDHVVQVGVALAVVVPLTLANGRGLRTLQLGDEVARGLGVRVQATRTVLIALAVALAAIATAAAGPIGFVALCAGPIARRLTATGGVAMVPAMLVGACIVLGADLVAQHLLGGLPVGVATALVGAPYLLALLARANRIGSDG